MARDTFHSTAKWTHQYTLSHSNIVKYPETHRVPGNWKQYPFPQHPTSSSQDGCIRTSSRSVTLLPYRSCRLLSHLLFTHSSTIFYRRRSWSIGSYQTYNDHCYPHAFILSLPLSAKRRLVWKIHKKTQPKQNKSTLIHMNIKSTTIMPWWSRTSSEDSLYRWHLPYQYSCSHRWSTPSWEWTGPSQDPHTSCLPSLRSCSSMEANPSLQGQGTSWKSAPLLWWLS